MAIRVIIETWNDELQSTPELGQAPNRASFTLLSTDTSEEYKVLDENIGTGTFIMYDDYNEIAYHAVKILMQLPFNM